MFPNPQDALPIPPRPDLEQYKKLAKDLLKAGRSVVPQAIHDWSTHWIDDLVKLSDLKVTPQLPVAIDRWINDLTEFARRKMSAPCALTDAQFVIARAHGFESWPKLAKHIEAAARAHSSVSEFEQAADAIVTGAAPALRTLLRKCPALIRARSTREHQATLLHYVSANGIEGYRQKTPANAVQIAEILLQAGADVNATTHVYGAHLTTLHLAATSLHPELAGVQNELMQLLLAHGAIIDATIVNACLANGRGPAAEFLAHRGAPLDLAAAGGVGRLDVVQTFFDDKGRLKRRATQLQMDQAFLFASQYGRDPVVEFLLQQGVSIGTQANTGQTALHWAIIGGHLDTVKLLISRGASLKSRNTYGGTPIGQALWSATHGNPRIDYLPILETLFNSGSEPEEGTLQWLAGQKFLEPNKRKSLEEVLRRNGAKS